MCGIIFSFDGTLPYPYAYQTAEEAPVFVINPRLFYAFALLALIVAQFGPKDAVVPNGSPTCVSDCGRLPPYPTPNTPYPTPNSEATS